MLFAWLLAVGVGFASACVASELAPPDRFATEQGSEEAEVAAAAAAAVELVMADQGPAAADGEADPGCHSRPSCVDYCEKASIALAPVKSALDGASGLALPTAATPEISEATPARNAASLGELVAATDSAGVLSPELECLAGAIYFEARGEPLTGQLAVAEVIINRSQSGRFPTTYCGVVRQPGQFSFVRKGTIPQARRGTQAWRNAVAIARIAHGGQWQTHADEALYFHARSVRPSWSHRKQALATIDSHIFYR